MLASFGDDGDGIECDYIGWHPHFGWRGIEQEFAFIHSYAGNKPVYVDDMWSNLFAIGYAGIPGNAQFTASRFPNRNWVKAINGDFPNALFTSNDPYGELFQKLNTDNRTVQDWYYANGARRLVKSFVTAFGEGAIIVNFSGGNDQPRGVPFVGRGWEGGWINLTDARDEDYSAGHYQILWDGTDEAGMRVASGVYLAMMRAGKFVQARKIILMK